MNRHGDSGKIEEVYSVEAKNYVERNGCLILREALPLQDPESWVSLWKHKYGSLTLFPWESLYGREPTSDELIRMGIETCPVCGRGWNGQ